MSSKTKNMKQITIKEWLQTTNNMRQITIKEWLQSTNKRN